MYAGRHSLLCQAAAAAVMVQISLNAASIIPFHARSRLLGPDVNCLFRQPTQIHYNFYVKPRDTMW